jgi:hypothetical protein
VATLAVKMLQILEAYTKENSARTIWLIQKKVQKSEKNGSC